MTYSDIISLVALTIAIITALHSHWTRKQVVEMTAIEQRNRVLKALSEKMTCLYELIESQDDLVQSGKLEPAAHRKAIEMRGRYRILLHEVSNSLSQVEELNSLSDHMTAAQLAKIAGQAEATLPELQSILQSTREFAKKQL